MLHVCSRREHIFESRIEAGRQLGREISVKFRLEGDTVVLGLPRGGLVIGCEVSEILGAPLDIVLAGKLSAPDEPEFAIGAITEDGSFFLDQNIIDWMNIDPVYLDGEKKRKLQMLEARKRSYRSYIEKISISGKNAIITDDGIATGASIKAALSAMRREDPKTLIVAIPVGPIGGLERIRDACDEVLCLFAPPTFHAVGEFYTNFEQLSDEEVVEILKSEQKSRLRSA